MGKCPICNTEGTTKYNQEFSTKPTIVDFRCYPCDIEWLELVGEDTTDDVCDCTLCIADGGTECKDVKFINEDTK